MSYQNNFWFLTFGSQEELFSVSEYKLAVFDLPISNDIKEATRNQSIIRLPSVTHIFHYFDVCYDLLSYPYFGFGFLSSISK